MEPEEKADVGSCGWVRSNACAAIDIERGGTEPVLSFQYYAMGVRAEFAPGTFKVEFGLETVWRVTVEGRNLRPLFDRLIWNVAGMLDHNRVHGDLSAHNILYWEGELRIIDFPQAVSPFENPNAFELFTRDVTRVCSYFARHGVDRDPSQLATDLWRTHQPTAPLPGDLLHEAEA